MSFRLFKQVCTGPDFIAVYRVAVLDTVTKDIRWNVSYTQYGSPSYTRRVSQGGRGMQMGVVMSMNFFNEFFFSDLLHFCSSSDGSMLSVNALTG